MDLVILTFNYFFCHFGDFDFPDKRRLDSGFVALLVLTPYIVRVSALRFWNMGIAFRCICNGHRIQKRICTVGGGKIS